MKRYIVSKEYSYIDGRGKVQVSGTMLTLDENSEHVKGQMYKLIPVDDPKPEPTKKPDVPPVEEVKKQTIMDKMVTKKKENELPKGTIKSRVEDMIKEMEEGNKE